MKKIDSNVGDANSDLELFGIALRDADLVRISLDLEGLEFEEQRLALECEERKKESVEWHFEREAKRQLDLEKIKVFLDDFQRNCLFFRYSIKSCDRFLKS